MEIRTAKAMQDQLVCGRLRFFNREIPVLVRYSKLSPAEEQARFEQARHKAVLQLAACYDRTAQDLSADTAAICAIHAMLLEDEDLEEHIYQMIWEEKTTAEYAVMTTGKLFANIFTAMNDSYMKARSVDIRDLSRRVIFLLLGRQSEDPLHHEDSILVADEFLPSEVIELDRRHLLGLISCHGSINSHAAMLLRAYHIPFMAEVELEAGWDGHMALMDGVGSRIYLDPDPEQEAQLRRQYEEENMLIHH